MLQKVSNYIRERHLIEAGDKIVIGVSGGADSVCLLYVLHELYREQEITLIVVHVNHGIRGEAAERDEEFVRSLANKLGMDFYAFHYDIHRIAEEAGLTEEEAGRNVRYESFLEICNRFQCNKIGIAHNKNDNAETVLFHLFRGSGIRGLSGIDPARKIRNETGEEIMIIRPLLSVERQEIEAYLEHREIPYCIDQTNLEDNYSRNKLRNRVLTYVTNEINANAIHHLNEASEKLAEIDRYIEKQVTKQMEELVKQGIDGYQILVEDLMKVDIVIRKGILLKIIEKLAGSRKDIGTKHLEEVLSLLDRQVGKRVMLPYGIRAVREYEVLRLFVDSGEQEELGVFSERVLCIPGITFLKEKGIAIQTRVIPYEAGIFIHKNSCKKWIDYDRIENAVTVRTRKMGDYFEVNSQGGNKKLKDYFIDHKIPQKDRDGILLIADGSHILWILSDGRMSEKYKINDDTQNILELKIINTEEKDNDR